ncbi:MAG TPA: type II toxin-antitoxin system prevent-host-death family antitoxin [Verrucomicrobiae bacterium]|nr:type II toxin-antitoxin system prevent-host-death family antitoxin [Verrucomicrobiae bacterium]
MKTVNIQAAKTHLSRLVEEAVAGEDIVLAKAGKPMVRLTPIQPKSRKRKLGVLKGRIKEMPGCWEPDPKLEAEFYDPPVMPE